MASMRLLRLALAALALAGCGTSTTSSLPTPTFQAPFDAPFVLRAGDLGLIAGAGQYLYISVLHVGQDSRCAAGATCADPGYLEISFDVETATLQNSLAMSVPTSGETTRTFEGLEIRMLGVEPTAQTERILAIDYRFLMSVSIAAE